MLVVAEGPDGAGKTTLLDQLERLLTDDEPSCRVVRLKAGPPKQHPLDEYLRPLVDYRPGGRTHFLLDRWHWGERVYPEVRGRSTQLDDASWHAIEGYMARLGAVVVYVTQYTDAYEDVYRSRGEDLGQLAELPLVGELYRQVQSKTLQLIQHFNWASPVNGDPRRIVRAARTREAGTADLVGFITYSGPRYPAFLLFGDVRHELRNVELRSPEAWRTLDPAFVPFPGTSGHFLRGALVDARATPLYGLANACDVDDPYRLWIALGKPRVVALGRNAQRRLRTVGVPHGAVPHPQFVRRFHHSKRAEYGRLIGRALTTREDYAGWPASSTADTAATSTLRFSKTSADAVNVARRATG